MAYLDLTRRYKEQPVGEVFSHFGYAQSAGESWETPYEKLARMAKKENWNFHRSEFHRRGQNYPILKGYLNFTFRRLQEQDRIGFSDDGDRACFNTGLRTQNEKDIFAAFLRNERAKELDQPEWVLWGFFDSYSSHLSEFRPLPSVATYITDASELVFDTSCEIEVNYDHVYDENRERLPEPLRDNRTLAIAAIQGSIGLLKEKVIRNYKLAIPHWYESHIQLLLPLNLTSDEEADLAMVAEKDPTAKLYRVRTLLTMDMAYMDARLITKPDREWLDP